MLTAFELVLQVRVDLVLKTPCVRSITIAISTTSGTAALDSPEESDRPPHPSPPVYPMPEHHATSLDHPNRSRSTL